MFRSGDIIIYLALATVIIFPFLPDKGDLSGNVMISISSDGNTFYADPGIDNLFVIKSGTDSVAVEVKDHMVRVKSSTCRDKYCEKKGWLKEGTKGQIVCMPNRVIVSFISDIEDDIDAVTE